MLSLGSNRKLYLRLSKTLGIKMSWRSGRKLYSTLLDDDDDEFRFNDASTHEGHLRQNV